MSKALIAILKYDYGVESRGYSFEYNNIYLPVCSLLKQSNVILFDFFSELKSLGRSGMNKKLKEIVIDEKPDFALFALFENEFDEDTISSLRDYTKTISYFIDDPWRVEFAKHWRKYFNYFSTPDYYTYQKYLLDNITNVIYSPFGFNPDIYKKLDLEKCYDVSFVGNYSPFRRWIIDSLRKKGINVNVYGRNWGKYGKWVSQDDVVRIFNQSKINLNLSNAVYYDVKYLLHSAFSIKDWKELLLLKKNKEQVKGRHFEINACGAFQLSYFVPGLNLIYEIDKEIAVFESVNHLADEINFFLNNDSLRNSIAEAGYKRSLTDHSSIQYLDNLIKKVLE
ncbi:MAG: glycosyltransferase [Ignavibacterium sp.]|jgi:spore maturation protein CgeB|nr:glycosyltransferase [Ignavibacterium sp.]